jgi:hypothetical protein
MRGLVGFVLLAGAAFAQTGVPRFTREGLSERVDGRPVLFSPGMIMTLYGENLGPESGCDQAIPSDGPYPSEACGVRVLVDGRASGLMFVGPRQINFKFPDEAPEEGSAPLQVCVRDTCSDRVMLRFSLRKAFLHLQGHAYVHMPVWIQVDQPWSDIRYPYSIFPLNLGGAEFEVLYKGEPVPPARTAIGKGGGTAAPPDSPRGRLPLHLIYHFDHPGTYSVRFTGRTYKYPGAIEIATQSDWTEIVIEPYSDAQRAAWLVSEMAKARSASIGELAGDIIPSLLAWPDAGALSVLLTLVDHPDGFVRESARSALELFDEGVQRRVIPTNRWQDLHNRSISILG